MTNHTDLIARLRKDDLFWEAPITCRSEAADALEAAQAEIERLTTDRRVLQADGKHPAPCAKFCEATAFTIELRRAHADDHRAVLSRESRHRDQAICDMQDWPK